MNFKPICIQWPSKEQVLHYMPPVFKSFYPSLVSIIDCTELQMDNLSEKPLWGTIFEKNIFNFQESIVFEKMRKNENSGFYLINYAKIRAKMVYFIASVPRQDSKL